MEKILRVLVLEGLREAGRLKPLTNEAKASPAIVDFIKAIAGLGLKKTEVYANKDKVRAALEKFIDVYGAELNYQLIGIGGMLLAWRGIDEKTNKVHPILGQMFPAARGKTLAQVKALDPELATRLSQIGPTVREIAGNLHGHLSDGGLFSHKEIKAYVNSKKGTNA